jgi:HSP20 family protein
LLTADQRQYPVFAEDIMTTLLEKTKETPKKEETLVEFEPFGPGFMGTLLADMRRFAEEIEPFFAGFGLKRRGFYPNVVRMPIAAPWTPSVELFYANEAIVVRAELPGLNKEDVKVEIVKGALTIEGERKYEKEVTKKGHFTTERAYGTFFRRIALPEDAMVAEAKAVFKNGVLEVTIPTPALKEELGRRLEIKAV